MTNFRIEEFPYEAEELKARQSLDKRLTNWPVVYTLSDHRRIYVGESRNAVGRLLQHRTKADRAGLTQARVILDDTFNKSVCLDLESYLIRLFAGDGKYDVLNRNDGITDSNYFGRSEYAKAFKDIFEDLRCRGAFSRSLPEIQNSDLFKLSPFKSLNQDQAIAVEDILSGLFEDLRNESRSRIVIQGAPGTGKTVVGIFLMKLLSDIEHADVSLPPDEDSLLSDFFTPGHPELLKDFKVALVVPQQSLRRSIQGVFRKTAGLHPATVLSPFEIGRSRDHFDLVIVDEAHRLNQRANQAAGPLNTMFKDINLTLFERDDPDLTQVDWIEAQSTHQIYLLDEAQAVRPADLPREATDQLVRAARRAKRHYPLTSQMRVAAGDDYVAHVRSSLRREGSGRGSFPGYDLRFFDDVGAMRAEIFARDSEVGLSRLLAGFAWKYRSKKDRTLTDISIDGVDLQWNATDIDWVNSPGSLEQVGSIHTIQGYDLNYAGVIIGPDLFMDPESGEIRFSRSNYFDPRGTTNNKARGITYSDDDILEFVRNIYAVLLTRGMLGTYVYVCDPALREYLRTRF